MKNTSFKYFYDFSSKSAENVRNSESNDCNDDSDSISGSEIEIVQSTSTKVQNQQTIKQAFTSVADLAG